MSLFRSNGAGRSEPDGPVVGYEELGRATRSQTLAAGTLACVRCDAPVALAGARVAPRHIMNCPFCLHSAPVREFLTLGEPTRPAHVVVRVSARRRAAPVSAPRWLPAPP